MNAVLYFRQHYENRLHLRPFIYKLLQNRFLLKKAGKGSSLEAETLKLVANGCGGARLTAAAY